jgi:hypothetical protein
MNIDDLNKQSQLFKNKLQDIKKQCYDEMNKKYSNILQEKMQEIHNTILKDVQKQNQQILDNYVKQFEELEQKRESDYNEMSQLMMSNIQQKEGEMVFSVVKVTHHGIKCEKCGKEPIIGYRYKCAVCPKFNLCEACELKNSETQEHKHDFIKMRHEEKNIEVKEGKKAKEVKPKKENQKKENKPKGGNPKPKEEKIIEIHKKKEFNYEIISCDPENLKYEAFQYTDKEVEFKIMLKNNCQFQWPHGKTKLVSDKNADIKYGDILLNNLENGSYQYVTIKLNIENMEEGEKKCILHFSVDNEIFGEPIILIVQINENKDVTKFRAEFNLSKNDYDSKRILEALKNANNDFGTAFASLFQ